MRIFGKCLLLLALVICSADGAAALTHNIKTIGSFISYRIPININTPLGFEFRNSGSSDETNVVLYCTVEDKSGTRFYSDSVVVKSWLAGRYLDTAFRDFTPSNAFTEYVITAWASLATDEDRSDDTLRVHASTRYEIDMASVGVTFPTLTDSVAAKTVFQIRGNVINLGVADAYEFPARATIRRASDGALVFQADTLVQAVYPDSPAISVRFPSRQTPWDVRKLPAGEYVAAVIVRYATDGDRTNDTAYSPFTIYANTLDHDVAVDSLFQKDVRVFGPDSVVNLGIRIRNVGASPEQDFHVRATIYDWNDSIVYLDSALSSLSPAATSDLHFNDFVPTRTGSYRIAYKTALEADEYPFNDSAATTLKIGYELDATVRWIDAPLAGDTLIAGKQVNISGTVEWRGSALLQQNQRVSARLLSLSGESVLSADTATPRLSLDLPMAQYHLSGVVRSSATPGEYVLLVYVPSDNNPSNDTLRERLTVVAPTQEVGGGPDVATPMLVPNPARSVLELRGFDAQHVSVCDAAGRICRCDLIPGPDGPSLEVSGLHAGKYFVRVTDSSGKVQTVGFVKQ